MVSHLQITSDDVGVPHEPSFMTTTAVRSRIDSYSAHVNPQWVRLLEILEMNVRWERCSGCELFDSDRRRVLDFLSGYGVHNVGHNHPEVVTAVREELERCGPAMIQSHAPELAGELAERLCNRAGGNLTKVFFGSSGSEGVEAAIKFVDKADYPQAFREHCRAMRAVMEVFRRQNVRAEMFQPVWES